MRGSEILEELEKLDVHGQAFIRWWRRENDFADYELVDSFRTKVDGALEFGGFELLDIDEMWHRLSSLDPKRIARHKGTKMDVIIWKHRDEQGDMQEDQYPYNARSIMRIFDKETRGDTLV